MDIKFVQHFIVIIYEMAKVVPRYDRPIVKIKIIEIYKPKYSNFHLIALKFATVFTRIYNSLLRTQKISVKHLQFNKTKH